MAGIKRKNNFWENMEALGDYYKESANDISDWNAINSKPGLEEIYRLNSRRSDIYGQFGCLCMDRAYDHNIIRFVKDWLRLAKEEILVDRKTKKAIKEAQSKGIFILTTKY